MHIDPQLRIRAVRTLLDAVSVADAERAGTDAEDVVLLKALEPLGLSFDKPEVAAALAAATELLFFFVSHSAKTAGTSPQEIVSNFRQYVMPTAYPEANE